VFGPSAVARISIERPNFIGFSNPMEKWNDQIETSDGWADCCSHAGRSRGGS
jgi:hypothetical protein